MIANLINAGTAQRSVSMILAIAVAASPSPSVSVFAQTNAAAMAVRQRAEGLNGGPEGGPPPRPAPESSPPGQPPASNVAPAPGKLDTRFISPNAAAVIVVRPAQFLASPLGQIFPVEVVSAAGLKQLGFDPMEMEEIIAFSDPFVPGNFSYGVTIKFKNPIRAASIPADKRAHAQLAEIGGKKYLKSAVPFLPSFYGPNNKTLVLATDLVLHRLVENNGPPATGPMIDRLRDVPSGSDLYVALDMTSIRPLLQMGMTMQQANLPPEAKQAVDVLNLISAAELTLNLSAPGPSSFVAHCTDDAAAQKIEAMANEWLQKVKAAVPTAPPGGDDTIPQAMTRYTDRVTQVLQPQRNGTTVTCFHIDGQNPAQQQLLTMSIVGGGVAMLMPAVQAAREAARRAQAAQGAGGPEGPGPGPGPGANPATLPPNDRK